ncbi:hypothetical protein U1Q18_040600 [Sarracenia purpurea var. burkii]
MDDLNKLTFIDVHGSSKKDPEAPHLALIHNLYKIALRFPPPSPWERSAAATSLFHFDRSGFVVVIFVIEGDGKFIV